MKTEKFDKIAEQPASLEGVLRQLVTRRAFTTTALVPIATLAGASAGWAMATANALPMLPLAISAGAVTGFAATYYAAKRISRRLAAVATLPIDLIASHLVMEGEDVMPALHMINNPNPRPSQVDADMALLLDRFAMVQSRAREVMGELEMTREQASLQNIAKSQFLANMSHELRTPLNAVLGYAMLLSEDALAAGNASAVADLDRIQVAGRHLLSLINDLLDLSKIETGNSAIERSVIDISTLVNSVAADFEQPLIRNGNRFEVGVEENIGVMIGDESKIRQCLANLISNAFKFTHNGQVAFDVRMRRKAGMSDMVVFSVADTGVGFDVEQTESLFETFAQADGSSSRRYGGTGLGLAISRRFARLMDGEIEVESTEGRGSIFRLVIPMNPVTGGARYVPAGRVDEEAKPVMDSHDGDALLPPGAGRTALVIDDNESALDLMRRWLTRLDYSVVTAHDGEQGIIEASKRSFDLIILDVLMPGRSGYDVLAQLREDQNTADTPIILVTVEDDRARGLNAGATEYVRKPIVEDQLRQLLEVYQTPARGDVLVIEDDEDAAELVMRCAGQVGFACRRAADGAEGMKMAHERRPSAIVLDLAMPRFDGFSVMDALRADEVLSHVPVIILSAREISLEDHQRIADAGYRFCMKGALSPREIAAHLKEMVA